MSSETKTTVTAALGFVFTIAVAGNGYFIKRLVDQVDGTQRAVEVQTVEIAKQGVEISGLKVEVSMLRNSMRNRIYKDACYDESVRHFAIPHTNASFLIQ